MSETNVGNMSETNLTERQRLILSAIKENPYITGKEMSETLSVTQRTVERDLAILQKIGSIRHEGKVNAGKWVVLDNNTVIETRRNE
jgi:ATP-dependent DNA helicase RecG